MRYVLNSPILTEYGMWEFSGPLSVEAAREFLCETGFQSAVGHDSTAQVLSELLGLPIAVQRREIAMGIGDEALVFQLKGRLPEGQVLSAQSLRSQPYALAILRRLA